MTKVGILDLLHAVLAFRSPVECTCGYKISSWEAFCVFCGEKNPGFSEETFQNLLDESIAATREGCASEHALMSREKPGEKFCSHCGAGLRD